MIGHSPTPIASGLKPTATKTTITPKLYKPIAPTNPLVDLISSSFRYIQQTIPITSNEIPEIREITRATVAINWGPKYYCCHN